MKKSLLIFVLLLTGYFVFTGQKIDDSPRWKSPVTISIDPSIQYSNFLPIDNNIATRNYPIVLMAPNGVYAIAPSFRPYPTTATQSECESYVNPNVPGALIVGWNSYGPSFYGTGFAYTSNSGVNWLGSNTLPGLATNSGDPSVVINSTGATFMNAIGGTSTYQQIITWTTNGGVNWSPYVVAGSNQGNASTADKNHYTIDDKSTSPYYNRQYISWTDFGVSSSIPPLKLVYSSNNGVNWSTPIKTTTPLSGHFSQGVNLHTGPNGEVYFVCCTGISSSPYTGDYIGFGKSTNGGDNWTVNESAIDINGIRGTLKTTGIRVADFPWMAVDKTGGTYNANIYVVWNQKNLAPAGSDPDICFAKSSNGGTNWSTPIRINNDPMNNGRDQWLPNICVDGFGGVNIIFYDSRNPSTNDSAEVYVARSIDGGNTFTNNLVSDHRFKPAPISGLAGGYQGDYIGISALGNKIYPFWADNFSGVYQVWTAPIDIGPSISHTPLTNTEQINGNRAVNCEIIPAGSPINPTTVKLYYSKDNPTLTTNVTMTNSGGNNWTANLPLTGAGLYRYYITATDNLSRTATYPAGAPANTVSFTAATDITKPVITHTALGDQPKTTWPGTVSATVTDNIGVDSVWVKWYNKNNPGLGTKMFKLNNAGGSAYSAAFNSTTGDVNFNDSIFYRVFARDISSNHNADSTALYGFKIINLTTITVGTGTTSSNFPFTTFWKDGRTQYLYLASDLAGMGSAAAITKIGFDVLTIGGPAMTDFKVSYKNTTITSLSTYETGGFTVAYNPTSYAPASTGWNMINLTTPMNYTGGNLLIDICYNNTTYTAYSTVNSTPVTGMYYGRYNDLTEPLGGCDYTAWTLTTGPPGRANTRFEFTTPVGITNPTSEIPNSYSLSQNYPNPFNPTTKINFALPKQGLVTLKIYDVLGREVRTLVNEVKSAGQFSVDFNASEFSSGVYFYKLESGTFSEIKRMMLIK